MAASEGSIRGAVAAQSLTASPVCGAYGMHRTALFRATPTNRTYGMPFLRADGILHL